MEVNGQIHAPAASTGGNIQWYAMGRMLGEPQMWSRRGGK